MTSLPRAADLRHRIVPELPVDTPDGAGGVIRTWQAAPPGWAQITPAGATAEEVAGRDRDVRKYTLTIRHRTDLCLGARLRWRERILWITAIRPLDSDDRYLGLECEERR